MTKAKPKTKPSKSNPPEIGNIFERRPVQYPVRLTRAERQLIAACADEQGISMQEWHRRAFLERLVRDKKMTQAEYKKTLADEKAAGYDNGASRAGKD